MKFAEKLLKHPEFLQLQKRVQEMEQDRIYCHHELSHALDVCRMAWVMYLEDEYKTHLKDYRQKKEAKVEVSEQEYRAEIAGQYITDLQTDDADHTEKPYLSADNMLAKKDQFYVTGLLHDIGRVAQYETGEHHSVAGVRIAEKLLTEIEYPSEWMRETLQIVGVHHGREETDGELSRMEYYIRRADHLSRNCFLCEASDSCKWKKEERNQTICW